MRPASLIILLVSGLSLLEACGDRREPAAGHYRVAVIPKGTAHEFWKAVEAGARRADDELADLEVVWKGPTGEGDAAQQITIVESFIAENYDGICLAPLDARALETPVRQAVAQGIPVVIFDSGLQDPEVPIVSYVATNNHHGGQMAAGLMADLLQGNGQVVLLRYQIGSESTEQREQGFLETLKEHPGLQMLSSDRRGGPDEARAIEVGENLLATFGERIDGIFCSNESSTSGMLTALRRDPRGLAGKVRVVGFDSSAHIVEALRQGVLQGTVLQDPVAIGYQAVMAMHARLTGREVPGRIETGEVLATPDNMDEPRIHALLFPAQAR